MKYTDFNAAIKDLKLLQEKLAAYNHAMGLMSLDASTAAPKESWEGRGKSMVYFPE